MSRSSSRPLAAARAEDFGRPSPWTWRDGLALLVLAGFIAGMAVNFFVLTDDVVRTAFQFAMPAVLSVGLLVAYGRLLAAHWAKFRTHLLVNVLLVLAFVVGLHLVLFLVRLPFGALFTAGSMTSQSEVLDVFEVTGLPLMLLAVLASAGPMLVALVEDTIFRHTLLTKIPVWSRGIVPIALLVAANAALFGAIHLWAFGGSLLATVPYMVIGLVMNLIYLWTRNMWFVLGTHIVFNSVAFLAALLGLVLRVVSGSTAA